MNDKTDVSHIDEGEINEPIGNSEQLQKPFMTIFYAPHSVWKVGFNCHGNDLSKHIGTHLYTHPIRELTEDEIKEVADSVCHTWKKNGVGELYMTDFARAIIKASRGEK